MTVVGQRQGDGTGSKEEQEEDSGREIKRPRGAEPGSRWSRQMEQQRQRTEPRSGHTARPGSQALRIPWEQMLPREQQLMAPSTCILVDSRPSTGSSAASLRLEEQAGPERQTHDSPAPWEPPFSLPSSSGLRPPALSASRGLVNPREAMSCYITPEGSRLRWRAPEWNGRRQKEEGGRPPEESKQTSPRTKSTFPSSWQPGVSRLSSAHDSCGCGCREEGGELWAALGSRETELPRTLVPGPLSEL
nr:uncharacterized protein LOC109730692 [Microcebus murinus]